MIDTALLTCSPPDSNGRLDFLLHIPLVDFELKIQTAFTVSFNSISVIEFELNIYSKCCETHALCIKVPNSCKSRLMYLKLLLFSFNESNTFAGEWN